MKRILLAAVAAVTLVGCSDDGEGPNTPGFEPAYEYSVSGDLQGSSAGAAYAGAAQAEDGQNGYFIILGSDTTDHALVLYRMGSERPATGTYEFAVDDEGEPLPGKWSGLYVYSSDGPRTGVFVAVEGRLTISESSNKRLRGTFETTGEGVVVDEENEEEPVSDGAVVLTGEFDASVVPNPNLSAGFARMPSARLQPLLQ